jgi:hypothetical protein
MQEGQSSGLYRRWSDLYTPDLRSRVHPLWGFCLVYYPLHPECLAIAKRGIDYNLNYGTQGVASMEELLKLYRQRHLDTKLDNERCPLPPHCALYEPHGYYGAVRWQGNEWDPPEDLGEVNFYQDSGLGMEIS